MKPTVTDIAFGGLLAFAVMGMAMPASAHGAGESHQEAHMGGDAPADMHDMMEMHRGHTHHHDFEAMEEISPEKRQRIMALMQDIGVEMPAMDPEHGRHVFLEKGCIACHSVNGVGGDIGPALDAATMPRPMNAFEFAARMWRGAEAMTALQHDLLGEVISLDGQDLADLVAFAHDAEEQKEVTADQIPERFQEIIEHN